MPPNSHTERECPHLPQTICHASESARMEAAHVVGSTAMKNRWIVLISSKHETPQVPRRNQSVPGY